tara:strand:+ start:3007 stop:4887 length:1881 start_codon:yes stop_codon:yes gene_type:complete
MDIIKDIKKNINSINLLNISELVKVLKYASDKYYNDEAVLTDEEYDDLYDLLKEKSPNNKFFSLIGSEIHSKEKIKLPFHMGSMEKMKPNMGLIDRWKNKYKGPYLISDKLDGVSGLFVVNDGKKKLYTRGNGTYGTDITSLIKYIKSLNQEFKNIAIRGEFIISKKNFKKYEKDYSNARAMVSGLINKKTTNKDEFKYMNFICYEMITYDSKMKYIPSQQLDILKKVNLDVVDYNIVEEINEEMLSSILKIKKKKSSYEIDGLVIYDNNKHVKNKSGNPKYAFAFKDMELNKKAEVEVIKVEWNISKDNLLKPRIFIKPVQLNNVVIKSLTGFNAKYIINNKIGKGSKLLIIRSGDVIPHIVDIVKETKAEMPIYKYKWTKNNVDIILDDSNLEIKREQAVKVITYFLKTLLVKGIDSKLVEKLVINNINTINKLLRINVDDLLKIDGFQETLAKKIFTNIQNSIIYVDLARIMTASNLFGAGFGIKKINMILDKYPGILKLNKNKSELLDMIINIEGFQEKTANKFVNNLDKFKKFLKENPNIKIKILKKKVKGNKFEGKIIVFSGFRDNELEKTIINEGGKVTSTITSNTDLLIVNNINDNSSKIKKSNELDIPIISKDKFRI